jgi:methylmalonyl-CoA/ethylmalonyl-CoA epimerase
VTSIDEAAPSFELVSGASCSPTEVVASQGVRVAFIGQIELIEPTSPSSTVQRFLDRRGPGLHHIAYAVADLETELDRLAREGIRLIDAAPRAGAFGHRVAFLHPASTGGTLVELVEAVESDSSELNDS